MDDKELEKMIETFVKKCKAKKCQGMAIIAPSEGQPKIGLATDYLKAVSLIRSIFQRLQDSTGIPSTLTVTHLALSMAALDVDKNKKENAEKVDIETLEEAAKVVRQLIDFELDKARKVNL